MADIEQAVDSGAQVQAPQVSVESNVSDSNSSTVAPAESQQQSAPATEKMIPQSQVNKIAAREAREAAEKARNEERARFERERAQAGFNQQQQSSVPPSMGGMQQASEDQIRQLIQQEAYKMSQHALAQQIERDWLSTMNAEREKDPEFGQLYDALNIEAHPDLLIWMNGLDNKASVVKDIAKNPSKFSSILMLARSGSPELAKMELNKLSASIKANDEAQKQAQVEAPLSQLKPSNIGSDNGDLSVSDYRLMFKG